MSSTTTIHPLIDAQKRLTRRLVEHTRFDETMQQIISHIQFPTDTKIIWVIGPTGVGKSRLAEKIVSKVLKDPIIGERFKDDPGSIPSVSFEVPCVSSNHQFAWRPFCELYLDQLKAPITTSDRKVAELPDAGKYRGPEHLVLNAIQHRRPIVTLLDEANHFANVASGKVLFEQMTRIKSFVNRTNVLHVFLGTYELAPLTRLSGQLARRSEVIHFGRYRAEAEADVKDFAKVVRGFQQSIPVAHHYNLESHVAFLHERSLGCIGTLKNWLMRALAHAFNDAREAIRHSDLEATALGIDRLTTMLDEIIQGENSMGEGTQTDLDIFLEKLGHLEPDATERDLFGQKTSRASRTRKAFEPLPRRFPVGLDENGEKKAV